MWKTCMIINFNIFNNNNGINNDITINDNWDDDDGKGRMGVVMQWWSSWDEEAWEELLPCWPQIPH